MGVCPWVCPLWVYPGACSWGVSMDVLLGVSRGVFMGCVHGCAPGCIQGCVHGVCPWPYGCAPGCVHGCVHGVCPLMCSWVCPWAYPWVWSGKGPGTEKSNSNMRLQVTILSVRRRLFQNLYFVWVYCTLCGKISVNQLCNYPHV